MHPHGSGLNDSWAICKRIISGLRTKCQRPKWSEDEMAKDEMGEDEMAKNKMGEDEVQRPE